MWRLLMAACIVAVFPSRADALVGTEDTSGRFSAVVRILSKKGNCSGIVLFKRLVATAGHCVLEDDGTDKQVFVEFTDPHGTVRMIPSRKVYVRDDYRAEHVRNRKEVKARKGKQKGTLRLKQQNDRKLVATDVAFIVLEDDILVSQKVLTAIYFGYQMKPPPANRHPGQTLPTRVVIAGYGAYECGDVLDKSTCRSDKKLRVATTISTPRLVDIGDPNKSVFFLLGMKGDDDALTTPLRPGDSGAPIFVEFPSTKGGPSTLMLIGIESSGGHGYGVAASLVINRHLYFSVLADEIYRQANAEKAAAFAMSATKLSRRSISIAWARADSMHEARTEALAECRRSAGRAKSACTIVSAYRHGCKFIAPGYRGGKFGWITGASVREVYATCRRKGVTCSKPLGDCL